MAHKHPVYDTDKHFSIDPVTRKITNECGKLNVQQYDHNSERFTFEIVREVDGHDMSKCNVVQIHFLNIEAANKSNKNAGIYEVDDLDVATNETEDVVFGSWLISGNATQYVGSLNFIVRFACVVDGNVEYAWNTAIHSTVTVGEGICNSDSIATEYADVLELWRQELIESGGVTDERIEAAVAEYMEKNAVSSVYIGNKKPTDGSLYWLDTSDVDKSESGGEEPDEPEVPEVVTYIVTSNLTAVTNDNSATSVEENKSYSATLSANDGYELSTVSVKMGGVDITNSAYANGNIYIASVTGDIVITAVATEIGGGVVTYTITNSLVNVTTDNPTVSVEENSAYTATLTVSENCELHSYSVTMGGVDITADVYADGVISIPTVTGNVVITAVAAKPSENLVASNIFMEGTAKELVIKKDVLDAMTNDKLYFVYYPTNQYNHGINFFSVNTPGWMSIPEGSVYNGTIEGSFCTKIYTHTDIVHADPVTYKYTDVYELDVTAMRTQLQQRVDAGEISTTVNGGPRILIKGNCIEYKILYTFDPTQPV